MNKSDRTKQIFMVLVPVVAWTGFALSHALVARQEEGCFDGACVR